MARVLVVSIGDLTNDPRVDRQIGYLRTRHEVVAAGLGRPAYDDVPFVDLVSPARPALPELARRAVSFAGLIGHLYESVYWRDPSNTIAVSKLADHRADVVIANDLAALPIACEAANGASVVFDAHELSTAERSDVRWWRTIMAPYVDALLRLYLPRVAAMMTVAPGIADIYERSYGLRPVVVTNAPRRADLEPAPVHEPLRLIHHGVADPQRCLELMIEATDQLGDRFTLDLMLVRRSPRYYERLERMAAACPRVNLIEPVVQREIVDRCHEYDVGMYLLPARNDNLLHALPNKIFEFIQARLALAVGPSPEMADVVRTWNCGVVAEDFSAEALARALNGLSPERVAGLKQHAHLAAAELNAERNGEIVLALIERVLEQSSGSRQRPGAAAV
jgi:hypothetical protein